MDYFSAEQTAKLLGITTDKLSILERQGILHPLKTANGNIQYPKSDIVQIKSHNRHSISEEAELMGSVIQKDLVKSTSLMKKSLYVAGSFIAVYILLVIIFIISFSSNPIQTAKWLGIIRNSEATSTLALNSNGGNVLGASTIENEKDSVVQTILQPVGKVSLKLVKNIKPDAYAEVSEVTILDPNDVLKLNTDGNMVPEKPIDIADSSLLKVRESDLVENLNSQYVQGRQPGTNPGDLAIVGDNSQEVAAPIIVQDNTLAEKISELTNDNFSGNAAISNSNLANSSITINTSGPISGGDTIALGGAIDIDCPTCITDDSDFVTEGSTNTFINKSINATDNTITGLNSINLEAGDYSSKITSGTYSINITGTVDTAINFSGQLLGDVTGTQTATSVEKIKGQSLGNVLPTSGNILIGNGSEWNSELLSGDATIDASGVITLKNTGTAGIFGSSNSIPIITTDAQGRVLSASTTLITGLGPSSLSSGDYSSVINSGIYNIDISGNASTATSATSANTATTANSATNFTGNLLGDVTGTQSSTIVEKINGENLGIVTPTSGNLLIGSGTEWVTKSLSGDATVNSSGLVSLVNTGTAGTYGSSSEIPVIITDSKGRVTGVANTSIANLSVSNFISQNISQWTNDSSFITNSSINNLTNKTISGITNTLSDISNSSLSNSSITFAGNVGSGNISLGSTINILGGGINSTSYSSGTLTITGTEADTLSSVTGRGSSTNNTLTLNGGINTTTTTNLNLDTGTTGSILIGTGFNSKNIGVGNTFGSTSLNLFSGTGNINLVAGPTSSSEKVQIGNSASATPDILVLDNGTADPSGINGAMYYNTATNKFRCYQNGWTNCISNVGADIQNAVSYDTSQDLTNIGSAQVTVTSVTVTPTTATGDVYVRAKAEILSSNGTDQTLVLSIEDNATCTGSTLTSNPITITSASGTVIGDFELSAVEVDAGTSPQSYSLCASTATGDTDIRLYQMFATVIDTGSDLAEIYTTKDEDLETGDIVSIDPDLSTGVMKSSKPYDKSVIGIVSTSPGVVIGSVQKEGVKAMPIALSGRVPTKVSTENGSIYPGDYLTTSSIPGVAMKSTKAGPIIGTAINSFDDDKVGKILVFVKNGSSNIDSGENEFVNSFGKTTVKSGESEAQIDFSDEYKKQLADTKVSPFINISPSLNDEDEIEDLPQYAVFDISKEGFKIKISKTTGFDIDFSWVAVSPNSKNHE